MPIKYADIAHKLQPPLDCSKEDDLRGRAFHNRLIVNSENTDFTGCVLYHCFPSGFAGAIEIRPAQSEEDVNLISNLKGADLHGADLRGANLEGANLEGADLQEADLDRVNLQGADLQSAILVEASLVETNLQNANLEYADLRLANLTRADLRGANLYYARYDHATDMDFARIVRSQLDAMDYEGEDEDDDEDADEYDDWWDED